MTLDFQDPFDYIISGVCVYLGISFFPDDLMMGLLFGMITAFVIDTFVDGGKAF